MFVFHCFLQDFYQGPVFRTENKCSISVLKSFLTTINLGFLSILFVQLEQSELLTKRNCFNQTGKSFLIEQPIKIILI